MVGDSINLAARLMIASYKRLLSGVSSADELPILCDVETRRLCDEEAEDSLGLQFVALPGLHLKGKSRVVECFVVERSNLSLPTSAMLQRRDSSTFRESHPKLTLELPVTTATSDSALFLLSGLPQTESVRSAELQALWTDFVTFAASLPDSGRNRDEGRYPMAIISGGKGVGKSKLLEDFLSCVNDRNITENEAAVVRLCGSASHQYTPFYLGKILLRRLLDNDASSPRSRKRAFESECAQLLENHPERDFMFSLLPLLFDPSFLLNSPSGRTDATSDSFLPTPLSAISWSRDPWGDEFVQKNRASISSGAARQMHKVAHASAATTKESTGFSVPPSAPVHPSISVPSCLPDAEHRTAVEDLLAMNVDKSFEGLGSRKSSHPPKLSFDEIIHNTADDTDRLDVPLSCGSTSSAMSAARRVMGSSYQTTETAFGFKAAVDHSWFPRTPSSMRAGSLQRTPNSSRGVFDLWSEGFLLRSSPRNSVRSRGSGKTSVCSKFGDIWAEELSGQESTSKNFASEKRFAGFLLEMLTLAHQRLSKQNVIIAIEDLHCCDTESAEIFKTLVKLKAGLFVVATMWTTSSSSSSGILTPSSTRSVSSEQSSSFPFPAPTSARTSIFSPPEQNTSALLWQGLVSGGISISHVQKIAPERTNSSSSLSRMNSTASILGGARSYPSQLSSFSGSRIIQLGNLAPDQIRILAKGIFQVADGGRVADNIVDVLSSRSSGNTLFAAELARHMIQTGAVIVDGGGEAKFSVSPNLSKMPMTLQKLMTAGLDALSSDARTIVRAASVFEEVGLKLFVSCCFMLCTDVYPFPGLPRFSERDGLHDRPNATQISDKVLGRNQLSVLQ